MASSSTGNSNEPNPSDPQITGYRQGDDSWTRWRNVFYRLAGKMTAEGEQQYQLAIDNRYEKEQCRTCEQDRDYLLQYSRPS